MCPNGTPFRLSSVGPPFVGRHIGPSDNDDDLMGGLVTDPRRFIGSHNPSAHQFGHAWEPDDEDDDRGDQCHF